MRKAASQVELQRCNLNRRRERPRERLSEATQSADAIHPRVYEMEPSREG